MNDAGTQQLRQAVFMVTIRCQCREAHQWNAALPKYWFNLTDMMCPECGSVVASMKAGEPKEIG